AAGQYDPGVFTSAPGNIFAGRDVTAVALQVPDADLGGTRIAVWARTSLFGHAPQLQVSRIGQAMLRPLFFRPPDPESETLNAVAVLAGSTLGNASVPRPPTAEFPYLSAPRPADLPALADLFGLREARSLTTDSAATTPATSALSPTPPV